MGLVGVSLEFSGVSERTARLLQSVQMVFRGFDLINVAKHAPDLPLEPLPCLEHILGGKHGSACLLMSEVVL
jgi:hypothetical protein